MKLMNRKFRVTRLEVLLMNLSGKAKTFKAIRRRDAEGAENVFYVQKELGNIVTFKFRLVNTFEPIL